MDGVVSEGNEARFAADIEALGAVLDHADLQEPDARLLLGAVDADRAQERGTDRGSELALWTLNTQ